MEQMPRLRLLDFRLSDGPGIVGICKENQAGCANAANRAQRRLIYAKEASGEGWWGSFAEVSFNHVSRATPYLTMSREIARIEMFDVCNAAIPVHNPYYEYLQFGNGRMPHRCRQNTSQWTCLTEAYLRNNAVTFVDPTLDRFIVRLYPGDASDVTVGKRVLLQGLDPAGNVIYSTDNGQQVQGIFVTLESPFVDAPIQFSRLTGIQKDITVGPVQFFQVDPATGDDLLLLTMDPGETVAGYRRYYLHNLPRNCCRITTATPQPVRVTAIAKLEPIPVAVDTDYLLLANLEAMIEECQAIRMSSMDNAAAQQLALVHHTNAIRLLNAELVHYMGKQEPAVSFLPFGSARLERQHIGNLM